MEMNITLMLVIANVGLSLLAFNNAEVMGKMIFDPVRITNNKQYYRFISSGFVHADYMHLAFNMLALYSFGGFVESAFKSMFGSLGSIMYLAMYFIALVVSLWPTYTKNKNNPHYLGLGASGAVSAVVFASLLLAPTMGLYVYFIPMVGFIFAPLYLLFSYYLEKRGSQGINHSAHIWGSLFGLAFVIFTGYFIADYPVLQNCFEQIKFWLAEKGFG
jgi:membrane associated rhomboid family serine protease